MGEKPPAVLLLTAFFGLQVVGATTSLALRLPVLNYQLPYWRTLMIYGGGASYLGFLCWRQRPRARFATYIFLSVDLIRALRHAQWAVVPLDLIVLLALQLPMFREAYPSVPPDYLRRRWRQLLQRGSASAAHFTPLGSEHPEKRSGDQRRI